MSGTQQRAELHKTIWALANELRGSVDGWDFKQYVLGTLFYRYISEDMAAYINERMHAAGVKDFNYEKFDDAQAENSREEIVAEKGIFIKPSQLFANVCKNARRDENLNTTLENAFKDIEASAIGTPSEPDFKGLFEDVDVNSNKLGETVAKRNARLVKILDAIAGLNPGVHIDYIFFNVYEKTTVSEAIEADVREKYGDRVLSTVVRKNVDVSKAAFSYTDIVSYDKDTNGAKDFLALTAELVEKL